MLRPYSLVRYRCMIQDILDTQYYGMYTTEEKNGQQVCFLIIASFKKTKCLNIFKDYHAVNVFFFS